MKAHRTLIPILTFGSGLLVCVSSTLQAAPKLEFNGDGRADVLVRNLVSGELASWLVNGNQILETASYGTVDPLSGDVPIAAKDVSADGRSDLLWYNVISGNVTVWLINGTSVLQTASYGVVPRDSGWVPVATEEFNADGRTDLLWYNLNTGSLSVWLLDGGRLLEAVGIGEVSRSSGWAPIGAKDFNGDAHSDLLWINGFTGDISVWLLNGGRVAQESAVGTLSPQSGWIPLASRDFDGNARADLLWYNAFGGESTIWLMNGAQITQTLSLPAMPPNAGWIPIASEDFSGDGHADLLWANGHTGSVTVWLLNSGQLAQDAEYATVSPSSGWSLAGFDDYNGDGRTDLFWFNAFSSETETWLVDGTVRLGTASLGALPRSSVWHPQIPR